MNARMIKLTELIRSKDELLEKQTKEIEQLSNKLNELKELHEKTQREKLELEHELLTESWTW
jgi:hypothetical protein